MNDQPMQPGITSSEAPTNPSPVSPAAPPAAPPTTPATSATKEVPTPSDGAPSSSEVVFTSEGSPKPKKGLIIAIIAIVAVLLIGGGVFAEFYAIYNRPANIIASSLNNLFSADQIEVDGSISLDIPDSETIGIESINLNFDNKASGISGTTTATLDVDFANDIDAPAIELGEVTLSDGVLYIEVDGVADFYNQALRDTIRDMLIENALYGYQDTPYDCYATDTDCLYSATDVDPAVEASVRESVDRTLDQIGEIIDVFDGQWLEISIDDVLSSDMFASMDLSTRQSYSDSYKCTANTINQMSNYSSEFANLYNQNPFVDMTAGDDSFYNISFDATNLANYLNALVDTQFITDISKCQNIEISSDTSKVTAEDVSSGLEQLPQISAKFDGIFDHHLTELKTSKQDQYYSFSADLKFSYPNSIVVEAPSESRPIMDVVEEIFQGMQNTQIDYDI